MHTQPSSFRIADTDQSIPERFQYIVKSFPNRLAIHSGSHQITYQELDSQANIIANHLLQLNITKNKPIAIHLSQGISFISSMLGVLKAGGFYVPIDPTFPVERNSLILINSEAKFILTDNENLTATQEIITNNQSIINFEKLSQNKEFHPSEIKPQPEDLAYLLYTSGSTGKPKGVMQNQRNVLFNARNQIQLMEVTHKDRFALFYSSSVMGGIRVLYNALMQGACLHYFDLRRNSVQKIIKDIIEYKVTIYHSVPSLFRALVDTLPIQENFPDLRLLILGGDVVSRKDVELYKQLFSNNCKFFTALGSTETGTVRHFIFDKDTEIGKTIPLGYSVEEVEISLQDLKTHEEVKPGEVGEIVVKSPYIALGYWQQPELTKKVFLVDEKSGTKVYRTRDLGKFEDDGCLYHQGRLDFQVKISGHRIELREIEYHILGFSGVKETIVAAKKNSQDAQYLIAYLLLENDALNIQLLKEYIVTKLPQSMIPSFFVILDEFPLTPNGKINRLALPEPSRNSIKRSQKFIAARSILEQNIVSVWSSVLGIDDISLDDVFLDLGGTSVLAIKLVNNLERSLGQKLPLSALAKFTTIRELSAILETLQSPVDQMNDIKNEELIRELMVLMAGRKGVRPKADSLMLRVNESKKNPFFFCANGLGEAEKISQHITDYSFYFLESGYSALVGLKQEFKGRRTYENIAAIASLHVRDILDICPEGPYLLAGYSLGGRITYEIAKQLQLKGKKVDFIGIIDVDGSEYRYNYFIKEIKPLVANLISNFSLERSTEIVFLVKKIIAVLPDKSAMNSSANAESGEYLMTGCKDKITLFNAVPQSKKLHRRIIDFLFPSRGWKSHDFEIINLRGNHLNIIYDEQNAYQLARAINNELRKVLSNQS